MICQQCDVLIRRRPERQLSAMVKKLLLYAIASTICCVICLVLTLQTRISQYVQSTHNTHLRQLLADEISEDEDRSNLIKKQTKRAIHPRKQGILPLTFQMGGLAFNQTGIGHEFSAEITSSVVHSFSPWIDQKLNRMFYDAAGENNMFATSPAMAYHNDEIIVVQRIWISNYEADSAAGRKQVYFNTWKENHAYEYRMSENYDRKASRMLAIPTPINCQYEYRADGVYDPRLSKWRGRLQMTFHLWMYDFEERQISGRMFIWDYEDQSIRKVKVTEENQKRLQRAEINWLPLDLNGTLHFIYSLDPLRVLRCDDNLNCQFVHLAADEMNHPFDFIRDKLRGGSPFIQYKNSPYYISCPHSQLVSKMNSSYYAAHIMVLAVEPTFRIVYVSSPIEVHEKLLNSGKIVRAHTIAKSFIYPVGAILWDDYNTLDVGVHLNDNRGFIIRLQGVGELLQRVITNDMRRGVRDGPPSRTVQDAVGNMTGAYYNIEYQ